MNVLLVLLAFWVPGLVFGAAIRLRGWTLAAAAPLLTFGIVALGVPVLGNVGIRWSLLNVALWTLVLAAVGFGLAFAVQRLRARRHPDWEADELPRLPLRDHLVMAGGVAAAMVVGAATFLRGTNGIASVQQGWDAPFHGNLVRWIAEHGDARPSTVGTIANLPNQTNYFYPDTYHALLALVFGKGGLTMMPTLNLAALAVIFTVPFGVAALCRVWGMPALGAAAAAAVSTWFSAFPYDSLWRGPLWPYVAGVALIPAMLALSRYLLKPNGIAGPVAIGVGVAGLCGLHTSVVFVVVVYFLLILLTVLFRFEKIEWRRSAPSLLATGGLAIVLGIPLVLPSLYNASGVTSAYWAPETTLAGGLGQTLTFSPMSDFPQWWVGVPAFVGIVLLVRRRRMLWMVGAYVLFGGIFMLTVSINSPIMQTLTSLFYNDHWRIAALVPLAGAVAFGEFAHSAVAWFVRKAQPRVKLKPAALAAVAVALLALVCGGLSKGGYLGRNATRLAGGYQDGPTVSKAEEAAFTWLGQHTRPGERVMNNKADGSAWMYALAGVQPVEWTFYGAGANTKASYLSAWVNDIDKYPDVRKDLTELRVRYLIQGKGMAADNAVVSYGVTQVKPGPEFRVVFHNEGATIYEIAGQSGATGPTTANGE
ncbi:DUF6541 family protein [Amycolatopsis benzoatilytica]|uniref:DUF6541 family protein n=1 Tax=Amycolatopsis benzoatilytica TaxID=346045 RepID=UPI000369ACC7|nr:DUF6541 family protein [Amycolatopsis benzoatilytica]